MPRALERQPGPWGQNRAEVSVAWPPLARSLGSADAGAGTDSAARSYFWSAEAEIRAQENSFWIINVMVMARMQKVPQLLTCGW